MEILVNNGVADSVKMPETAMQANGRFTRIGCPVHVWDPVAKRMRWRQYSESQNAVTEAATVMIVSDGDLSAYDFDELRAELQERRDTRRSARPTLAPPNDVIAEACKQVVLQRQNRVTVGDVTFERPSRGLLIPRDKAWADAMAEESKKVLY